jgi:hypothetical protein
VSDALRIDLALARAVGLPLRSANDASAPAADTSLPGRASDPLFSPLALLLARFVPPANAPAPTPTPDEARLLHAYLQQRVVAALRADGLDAPSALRVAIDRDGALRLSPAPAAPDRVVAALRRDPDIARLLEVLQHAAIGDSGRRVADAPVDDATWPASPARPAVASGDARRAWPWRMTGESGVDARALPDLAPLLIGLAAALLLGWWLFG